MYRSHSFKLCIGLSGLIVHCFCKVKKTAPQNIIKTSGCPQQSGSKCPNLEIFHKTIKFLFCMQLCCINAPLPSSTHSKRPLAQDCGVEARSSPPGVQLCPTPPVAPYPSLQKGFRPISSTAALAAAVTPLGRPAIPILSGHNAPGSPPFLRNQD